MILCFLYNPLQGETVFSYDVLLCTLFGLPSLFCFVILTVVQFVVPGISR